MRPTAPHRPGVGHERAASRDSAFVRGASLGYIYAGPIFISVFPVPSRVLSTGQKGARSFQCQPTAQGLESAVGKLSIVDKHRKSKTGSSTSEKDAAVVESWEDELSAGEDTETDTLSSTAKTDGLPDAPPPTPASPTSSYAWGEEFINPYSVGGPEGTRNADGGKSPRRPEFRPEKTDAMARRMIAGALGVRAPRKTEEGMEYEKAVKERERKKRDQEREARKRAEEDTQRAKAAVWGD
ncbi:hypothetical protein GP486_006414 [Trichoglossum hirsutum]|uniref:Uncharacterized protein n=1 Tax=Trichoglossum hirsutum TaxID=265104 RepID=A0A9P8IDQ8_9PEZI|nr:hypothetical protein GP486_006414 [Trichoglossum hirsutum]